MRILLVEPTVYDADGTMRRLDSRPTQYISLTLPHLAALLPGTVDIDLAYEICEDVEESYDLASYDLVGITVQTIQMRRAIELSRCVRAYGPSVVIGGPATIEDEGSLVRALSRFADAVVVGDAELVWRDVVEDARAGQLKPRYQADEPTPMAEWPIPRFDLVNFGDIEAPHVLPSLTAKGCPRRCTFCSEFLYSRWALRPVDEVVAELLAYRDRFEVPRVVFRDDDFLVHPARSKELLSRLIDEGIEWGCQTDFNLARHPDVVDLALRSGMKAVSFGVESVREANRISMEKMFFTIPEAEELLIQLQEAGVETQVNVIFGFDHDDPDVFDETYDFLVRTKVSRFFPSVLYPIPGTPLYQQLEEEGRLLAERPPSIEDSMVVWFEPKNLTAEELVAGYESVEARFDQLIDERPRNYWLGRDMVVI